MARPNIVFDKQPTLKRWHYALIFLVAVLVSAYFMWPVDKKPEVARQAVTSGALLAFPYGEAQESKFPQLVAPPLVTAQEAQTNAQPPSLSLRVGIETGAQREAQKRDHWGNNCIVHLEALTTQELSQLIPPKGEDDACFYRSELFRRPNMSPSEYFAPGMEDNRMRLIYISVIEFYQGGLWKVTDFERLAEYDMDSDALLMLYVILHDAGSAKAETLKNRFREGGEMRRALDIFVSTGHCPPYVIEDSPCRDHMPTQ